MYIHEALRVCTLVPPLSKGICSEGNQWGERSMYMYIAVISLQILQEIPLTRHLGLRSFKVT